MSSRRRRACSWKARGTCCIYLSLSLLIVPICRNYTRALTFQNSLYRYLLLFRYGRVDPECGSANNVHFHDVAVLLDPEASDLDR